MQWSVLLPVVLTLIATHDDNSKVVDLIANMCYTKWALEAFVVSNAKRFAHEYQFPVSRITPAPNTLIVNVCGYDYSSSSVCF